MLQLVEGAGGALLDDASEIKAGVASVIKHLDRNADHALSRSDLLSYWGRLGEYDLINGAVVVSVVLTGKNDGFRGKLCESKNDTDCLGYRVSACISVYHDLPAQ